MRIMVKDKKKLIIAVSVVVLIVAGFIVLGGRGIPTPENITAGGISSAEDLINIAKNPGGDYILTRDIDLSQYSNWTPIATFRGKFNGNGHKIKNLKINSSLTNNIGLFGNIETGAEVRDLNLENVDIIGKDYVGALAGSCNGTITNCTATGKITQSGRYVGGMFGAFEGNAEKVNCAVSVSGTECVGGLAGIVSNGNILQCRVKGNNVSVAGINNCAGGLIGLIQPYGDIEINETCAISDVYGSERVGGFIGWLNISNSPYDLKISNCYAQGNITRCEDVAGGFIGALNSLGRANIALSYNYTSSKLPSYCKRMGGFVGTISTSNLPSIISCYWERQPLNEKSLSENGIGETNDNSLRIDPLTPESIKTPASFNGWDSVISKWNFDNSSAPTLRWE